VAFLTRPAAGVGDVVTVQIIAEHDPAIAPFRVRLRVRRLIDDPPWHSLGAEIEGAVEAQDEHAFRALVSYYSEAEV